MKGFVSKNMNVLDISEVLVWLLTHTTSVTVPVLQKKVDTSLLQAAAPIAPRKVVPCRSFDTESPCSTKTTTFKRLASHDSVRY